jgi:hypothetical protein
MLQHTGNAERAVPDARRTILVLLSDEVDNPARR